MGVADDPVKMRTGPLWTPCHWPCFVEGPGIHFPLTSVVWEGLPVPFSPISFSLLHYFFGTLDPGTETDNGVGWRDPCTCTCNIIFVVYGVESFSTGRKLGCHIQEHESQRTRLPCACLSCGAACGQEQGDGERRSWSRIESFSNLAFRLYFFHRLCCYALVTIKPANFIKHLLYHSYSFFKILVIFRERVREAEQD